MSADSDAQAHTGGGNRRGTKESFGSIRTLSSGRVQARYTGPDGRTHTAPTTFQTRKDARAWLAVQRADITRQAWNPEAPSSSAPTFGIVAEQFLATPTKDGKDRKPRTVAHYRALLDKFLLPTFGNVKVNRITRADIERWHVQHKGQTPTYTAHAYSLLKTVLDFASRPPRRHITANPCDIPGAGTTRRIKAVHPASVDEIEAIAAAMPDRLRLLVLLTAWGALRFGEATELRRKDVDLKRGVVKVRRAVYRVNGRPEVGTPKTAAGVRDVSIPPHLHPLLEEHLAAIPKQADALLFSAADGTSHLPPASLYGHYYKAREAAGRPDLRFHDLRHSGAVLAALTGATLAELMQRLGHSTPGAAMRYQHAAKGRADEIARRLSDLRG